jgi:hypothetical protein
MQAFAHCGQAKNGSQDGENNSKDEDSYARTEKQQSRADSLSHWLSFQQAFVFFIDAIVVVRGYSRDVG